MGANVSSQTGGSGRQGRVRGRVVPAMLPPLPGDLTDDAIARMGLDEFLVRFGGVTREIAAQFSVMYSPSTSQVDPVIDLDLYVSLMVTQPRPNVLQLLRLSYAEGVDYVIREIPKTGRRRHGGHLKKRVLLTPDCFKRLCMRSRTSPFCDAGVEAVADGIQGPILSRCSCCRLCRVGRLRIR